MMMQMRARPEYLLSWGFDPYLEAASAFTRSFRLVEEAALVGAVTPDHFFTRACTLELPNDLPVPVQVFLFWLVVLMWRRADSAAAGAS